MNIAKFLITAFFKKTPRVDASVKSNKSYIFIVLWMLEHRPLLLFCLLMQIAVLLGTKTQFLIFNFRFHSLI